MCRRQSFSAIRDWSLITGSGGGGYKTGGGSREVLPLRKGGRAQYCRGGAKSFHSLKEGAQKVIPCLEGGGAKRPGCSQ